MARPRLGHIQFINCLPLYYGLVKNDVLLEVDLVRADPKDLAADLIAGGLDIAPIPSIEYARHADDLVLLPDIAITSFGEVQSILLLSKVPAEQLGGATVALTAASRTSQVLARVLLEKRWGVECAYVEMPSDLPVMLKDADAVLLIGDDALRAYWQPPDGLLAYDLGTEWTGWTGLPMVYAVWAVRREYAEADPAAVGAVADALNGSTAERTSTTSPSTRLAGKRSRPRTSAATSTPCGSASSRSIARACGATSPRRTRSASLSACPTCASSARGSPWSRPRDRPTPLRPLHSRRRPATFG
jgi:chorismate dehydratase